MLLTPRLEIAMGIIDVLMNNICLIAYKTTTAPLEKLNSVRMMLPVTWKYLTVFYSIRIRVARWTDFGRMEFGCIYIGLLSWDIQTRGWDVISKLCFRIDYVLHESA